MLQAAMPVGEMQDPNQIPGGSLNANDRAFWNGFVQYVQKKGLKGSPELDKRDLNLSKKLFSEYSAANNAAYDYDTFVPQVQQHISDYRNKAIEQIKTGKAQLPGYNNDPKFDFDANFMSGLSAVDGWAGSKTTSWQFPQEKMVVKDPNGNKVKELPNAIFQDISRVPVLSSMNKQKK